MNLLEDLQERLAQRRVIVIAGAGVSIASSGAAAAASWKGLLELGVEHCVHFARNLPEHWAERMNEDLATDDVITWLSVASQVQERLLGVASGEFRSWLEDTIGQLKVEDDTLIEALRSLKAPIATTNYDNLIEDVTGWPPVTWRDPGGIQRVLQGDEQAVIHLHGHYRDPGSVILGYRSYARVLGDRATQALQQALRATHSSLYVGFGASFQDPNFSAWLAWARKTFHGRETYRHYRLCRDGERSAVEAEHQGDDRIFVLPFGERHEALGPFLRGLAPPDAGKQEPNRSAPPEPGLPPADWLFGRDDLLLELVEHLCSESPAPVPILGGPGMGKTALSVHAFRHSAVEAQFGKRRYFVRCEGVTSAGGLPGAIVAAMGLQASGDPRAAVLQALAAAPTLLVLDNLETPWDQDRPAVESLLSEIAPVPGLALVASVRGSLRPHGVRWRATLEIGKLAPTAAEKLFHEISGDSHRGDPELGEILALLDGVPLAIRLMAHAAAVQPSLRWVLDTWQAKRTAMLRRADGKDDDLEVSIALSLEGPRPDTHGRRLASALGLLPGGLAFEDLEALFPDEGHPAAVQLAGAGLAFFQGERLYMLAPVREATGRLVPADEPQVERIVHHYLDLARDVGGQIGATGGREALVRLEPELGNLEAAFERALAPHPDAAFAARSGLAELMRYCGIGSPSLLLEAAKRARSLDRSGDEANCIKSLGDIALTRSDHDGARERYEEALPLYRRVGNVLGGANCIRSLGDIALVRSDHDAAHERYEEVLPLFRRVGSVLGEANCIGSLGYIALARSDHDSAHERYEEALPLFRRVGSVLGEANCINGLGYIALRRSDHDAARERHEEALLLFRQVGSMRGEADCIQSLGDIALRRSDHDAARERYEEALPLFRRVGNVLGEANCIRSLGYIALRRSDHDAARERYEEALQLYRRVGSVLGEANCIQSLGDIEEEGDSAAARDRWRQALELYERIPEPYSIGYAHQRLARTATDEAEHALHLESAREAWGTIGRADLIEHLDD